MSKAELIYHIMGYIEYLMIPGKGDTPMSKIINTKKISEYHGENIERLCQELAHHISAEADD